MTNSVNAKTVAVAMVWIVAVTWDFRNMRYKCRKGNWMLDAMNIIPRIRSKTMISLGNDDNNRKIVINEYPAAEVMPSENRLNERVEGILFLSVLPRRVNSCSNPMPVINMNIPQNDNAVAYCPNCIGPKYLAIRRAITPPAPFDAASAIVRGRAPLKRIFATH